MKAKLKLGKDYSRLVLHRAGMMGTERAKEASRSSLSHLKEERKRLNASKSRKSKTSKTSWMPIRHGDTVELKSGLAQIRQY